MKRPRDPDDRRDLEPQPSPPPSSAASSAHVPPFENPLPAPPAPKAKLQAPPLPSPGLTLPSFAQSRQAEPVPTMPVPLEVSDLGVGLQAVRPPDFSGSSSPAPKPRGSRLGPSPFEKPKPSCVSENASRSPIAREAFSALLLLLGDLSALGNSLQHSSQDHVGRILQMFVAATVIRYCSAFRALAATILDLGFSLASLSSVQLADALVVLSLARGADPEAGVHSATAIKAIRWVRRNLEVHCLEISYSLLISSFLKSKIPRERKEAVPLSLYVVMHFERRILMQDCTEAEVLLLGSFLVLVWASLRFMDGQRVHFCSLSFDGSSLRGSCYQTKTSSHGQPFGLMCQGFLSHGSFTWTYKFLRALDAAIINHTTMHPSVPLPSSLLLALGADGKPLLPLQPMSYASALKHLRHMISLPWKKSRPYFDELSRLNFTVHSLKTTMLSWFGQLPGVDSVEKHAQGHHRMSSAQLYSREDIIPALRGQQKLREAVLQGTRFMIPLHRGAQHPMPEPPVQLESFNKSASLEPFRYFSHFQVQEGLLLPAFSASSDAKDKPQPPTTPSLRELQSEDEHSSDSSADEACDLGDAEEMVLASSTGVHHSMVRTTEATGLSYKGILLRAACGVPLHPDTVRWSESFAPTLTLCRRRACCIILARCGAQLE